MTAAFDATGAVHTGGVDQRFPDALSGADGTGDPSVLMPVLDVYPDALSAPMPVDLMPVRPPSPGSIGASSRVPATPVAGPAARTASRTTGNRATGTRTTAARTTAASTAAPAGRRPAGGQPAPGQPGRNQPVGNQPVRNQPALNQLVPQRPVPGRAGPAYSTRPTQPGPANPPVATGRMMTAADVSALFRNLRSGQSEQFDRLSYQATHPQSMGSTAPSAVAPAAPMASQYSGAGPGPEHRPRPGAGTPAHRSSAVRRRASSVWAVMVFLVVIVFARGWGRRSST